MRNKLTLNVCNRMFLLAGVLLIIMGSFVSALGLGGIGQIQAYPGQIVQDGLSLQNLLSGASEVTMEGEFVIGSEVISFSKSNKFTVPAGQVVSVPVTVKVPADAAVGTRYPVRVVFSPVAQEEGGIGDSGVSFVSAVSHEFSVLVVDRPANVIVIGEKKTGISAWVWVLIVVALIVIVWWFLKKKQQ